MTGNKCVTLMWAYELLLIKITVRPLFLHKIKLIMYILLKTY